MKGDVYKFQVNKEVYNFLTLTDNPIIFYNTIMDYVPLDALLKGVSSIIFFTWHDMDYNNHIEPLWSQIKERLSALYDSRNICFENKPYSKDWQDIEFFFENKYKQIIAHSLEELQKHSEREKQELLAIMKGYYALICKSAISMINARMSLEHSSERHYCNELFYQCLALLVIEKSIKCDKSVLKVDWNIALLYRLKRAFIFELNYK